MAERYIRMSHKCYEALYTLPMSDGERRVLMMIVRYTVGFHRYDTDFSNRFAAETLEMSVSGVNRSIRALIKKKYIYIISKGCGPHPQKIGLNYKEISVQFSHKKRSLSAQKAFTSDTKSVHLLANEEKIGKERIINKKEETLQATSFSPNRGREPEVSEEEWQRLLAEQWEDEE